MAQITLQQAALWCGGQVAEKYKNVVFDGAHYDSRKLQKGQLFVALVAARDGHDFIPSAMEKGAAAVLCNRVVGDYPAIVVADTRIALGQIAAGYLKQMGGKVIGVTGSVGKSTTKEMIASVAATTYKVSKTPANHNNDLGLPAAVLAMDADTRVVVLEMGMSHFGEIEYLSQLANPQLGVIINVGTMHIENLGSREGILQAKLEIAKGMPQDGKLLLYGDNDLLWSVREQLPVQSSYFGVSNEKCALQACNIQETENGIHFDVRYAGGAFAVYLPLEGAHYVSDAMAAVSVGLELGISVENIQKGLADFQNMEGRQEIFDYQGITVIKDCYNAGPESMAAALQVLKNRSGRKIAVLGDMLELGAHSHQAHFETGKIVAKCADVLLCYGPACAAMAEGALEGGMQIQWVHHFTDRSMLAETLQKLSMPGDVLLFKGSRGMKMELALEQFMTKER